MNRFQEFLATLRGGSVVNDLDRELRSVVEAVDTTGKAGTLTLTLKVMPKGRGTIEIADEIKGRPPVSVENTVLYVDLDFALSRRDPRQLSLMDLKEINEETPSRAD